MKQPPRQHARRIEYEKVTGNEKEKGGNDCGIKPEAPIAGASRAQSFFSGVDVTRAPHEHTMLRVAHSIFSRRPQAEQRR
jgi:hypothetical protein